MSQGGTTEKPAGQQPAPSAGPDEFGDFDTHGQDFGGGFTGGGNNGFDADGWGNVGAAGGDWGGFGTQDGGFDYDENGGYNDFGGGGDSGFDDYGEYGGDFGESPNGFENSTINDAFLPPKDDDRAPVQTSDARESPPAAPAVIGASNPDAAGGEGALAQGNSAGIDPSPQDQPSLKPEDRVGDEAEATAQTAAMDSAREGGVEAAESATAKGDDFLSHDGSLVQESNQCDRKEVHGDRPPPAGMDEATRPTMAVAQRGTSAPMLADKLHLGGQSQPPPKPPVATLANQLKSTNLQAREKQGEQVPGSFKISHAMPAVPENSFGQNQEFDSLDRHSNGQKKSQGMAFRPTALDQAARGKENLQSPANEMDAASNLLTLASQTNGGKTASHAPPRQKSLLGVTGSVQQPPRGTSASQKLSMAAMAARPSTQGARDMPHQQLPGTFPSQQRPFSASRLGASANNPAAKRTTKFSFRNNRPSSNTKLRFASNAAKQYPLAGARDGAAKLAPRNNTTAATSNVGTRINSNAPPNLLRGMNSSPKAEPSPQQAQTPGSQQHARGMNRPAPSPEESQIPGAQQHARGMSSMSPNERPTALEQYQTPAPQDHARGSNSNTMAPPPVQPPKRYQSTARRSDQQQQAGSMHSSTVTAIEPPGNQFPHLQHQARGAHPRANTITPNATRRNHLQTPAPRQQAADGMASSTKTPTESLPKSFQTPAPPKSGLPQIRPFDSSKLPPGPNQVSPREHPTPAQAPQATSLPAQQNLTSPSMMGFATGRRSRERGVGVHQESLMKTPAAKKVRDDPNGVGLTTLEQGASLVTMPPASVTPGPPSGQKKGMGVSESSITVAPGGAFPGPPAGLNANRSASVVEEAGAFERILPTPMNFDDMYADFQHIIRDLTTFEERGDSAFLNMNVDFSTAYAETLQDQSELSMMLGDLYELNTEFDSQIAEYHEFLGLTD